MLFFFVIKVRSKINDITVIVGISGYFVFADSTKDQVTLNLDKTPALMLLITGFVSVKKWLTYALPLERALNFLFVSMNQRNFNDENEKTAVAEAIEERIGADSGRSAIVRVGLVALTTALALTLPFFGLFQSLYVA